MFYNFMSAEHTPKAHILTGQASEFAKKLYRVHALIEQVKVNGEAVMYSEPLIPTPSGPTRTTFTRQQLPSLTDLAIRIENDILEADSEAGSVIYSELDRQQKERERRRKELVPTGPDDERHNWDY
jgi:hypothetical protein